MCRPRLLLALFALLLAAACAERPALRVGSSGDYPPFSERTPDGAWRGFDVEVARRYAADRGRAVVFVPFRWPELAAALARRDFDVAMSGVTVRAERLLQGRFTAAVARTSAVLVAPPAAPDPPRRVAVNRGGHLERVARTVLPDAELVLVDDNRALLAAVDAGSADAAVADALEVAGRVATGALAVRRTLSRDRKAYWLRGDDEALAHDLDGWLLAHERDGTLPALRATSLGADAGPSSLAPATAWAVDAVARRLLLMPAVALAKREAGLPLEDPAREAQVVQRAPDAVRPLARAEIEAAKAVQGADPPPDTPRAPLADLRVAIDRLDDSIAGAIAAAAPIGDAPDAILSQLRADADLPGADDAVFRPLVDALRALPAPP